MTFLIYRIEGLMYKAASALHFETPWVLYGGAPSDTIAVWCTQLSPTILLACKNDSSCIPFPKWSGRTKNLETYTRARKRVV